MKKTIYFLTMILAVALMSTACEKDDPDVPEQTLEEQYPEWADLTWVSTDGNTDANDEDNYPRLEITIVDDVVNVHQLTNGTGGFYDGNFTEVIISGNVITLTDNVITDEYNDPDVTGTFSENGGKITFTTFGLMNTNNPENEYTYVLE